MLSCFFMDPKGCKSVILVYIFIHNNACIYFGDTTMVRIATDNVKEKDEVLKTEQPGKKRLRQAIKTQDTLRKKSGRWNGVSEVRKWRNNNK